jgi:amidase
MTYRIKAVGLAIAGILFYALLICPPLNYAQTQDAVPIHFKSATELVKDIKRGKITAAALLDLYLERIKRFNPKINAVVAMDIKAAKARAAEADRALARGVSWGPLHGLPMTVKDVFEVAGMPATSGDPRLKNHLPEHNAAAVQRLVDAGAIIFGKTNLPLYAGDFQSFNKVYGTTNNPWDLSRTPGGSSGGSAAALAAGLTPLEMGSDLGGSLRIPPHFTGVYGHKPTYGLVPRYGHIPPAPNRKIPPHIMARLPLFVAGPLARSAADLELALKVLTTAEKPDPGMQRPKLMPPPSKPFASFKAAFWFEDSSPETEVDAQVMAALQKTVEKLRAAGLRLEQARPDIDLVMNRNVFMGIAAQMRSANPIDPKTLAAQKALQLKWGEFFEKYDVLLTPVCRTLAIPHTQNGPKEKRTIMVNGKKQRYMSNAAWTLQAVVAGLPATAAPIGLSESGLPVGIQIIGARLEDLTTIAFAKGLAELLGGFKPPPGY